MTDILQGIPGVVIYVDNILVHGATEAEHDAWLPLVLEALRKAGVKLNHAKCKYRQRSLDYFSHMIDENGLSPSKDKVNAILELKPPNDQAGLRQILGMIQYLGWYIPNCSEIIHPLNQLLKVDSIWC